MKRINALALALVATIAFAVPAAHAGKVTMGTLVSTFRPPTPSEQQALVRDLEMTEDQRSQMKELDARFRRETRNLRQEYQKAYRSVVQLMQAGSVDSGEVIRRVKRFNEVHNTIVEKEVQYWVDLKNLLEPPQRKTLAQKFLKSRVRR